jgi:hypothetical protein
VVSSPSDNSAITDYLSSEVVFSSSDDMAVLSLDFRGLWLFCSASEADYLHDQPRETCGNNQVKPGTRNRYHHTLYPSVPGLLPVQLNQSDWQEPARKRSCPQPHRAVCDSTQVPLHHLGSLTRTHGSYMEQKACR